MEIKEIINDLEFYKGYYPEKALRETIARKEEIIPELLKTLYKSLENMPYLGEYLQFNGYIMAFYLLSQFRVKEAFPLITEFFTYLENDPYDFTGNLITETLDRILASVYNGELSTLHYVVLERDCDEFVRVAFLNAILILFKNGLVEREEVIEIYRSILNNLERKKSYIWHSLVKACAILKAKELTGLIRKVYDDNLIDTFELPLEEVLGLMDTEYDIYSSGMNYNLIDDAIEETNWWSCYTNKPEEAEFYKDMSSMNKEIIRELEYYRGYYPREAINKAIENQKAITPDLLKVIEWTTKNPKVCKHVDYTLHIFACYLLGKFEEKRAFPVIIDLITTGIYSEESISEFVFFDLSNILAATYNGDHELLMGKILNRDINEDIKYAFMESFITINERNKIERDVYLSILKELFLKLKKEDSSVWVMLVNAAILIKANVLLADIMKAYTYEQNEFWLEKKEVEKIFKGKEEIPSELFPIYVDDIYDTEWWGGVELIESEENFINYPDRKEIRLDSLIENRVTDEEEFDEDYEEDEEFYSEPVIPYVRKGKKIGRNDPCPCGSGKKYKKCCGKIE
ncbi:MAG: DUF1186 domain-containing protein [Candidatus Cloacimonetes bacterium]|nr:DUF1186 domain-containing protein [Candidatus Cloacimonadota bacterium]